MDWTSQIPEGLHQPLHPLSFTLNLDLRLELPQGFVQIHSREVHLIQDAAAQRNTGTLTKPQQTL